MYKGKGFLPSVHHLIFMRRGRGREALIHAHARPEVGTDVMSGSDVSHTNSKRPFLLFLSRPTVFQLVPAVESHATISVLFLVVVVVGERKGRSVIAPRYGQPRIERRWEQLAPLVWTFLANITRMDQTMNILSLMDNMLITIVWAQFPIRSTSIMFGQGICQYT